MDGYAHMTKEQVIRLGTRAIEAITEEKQNRIRNAINTWKDNIRPSFLQRIKLIKFKPSHEYTDKEVLKCIEDASTIGWNWHYHNLMYYGDDLIARVRTVMQAAIVAEDYVLIEASLAEKVSQWSNRK